MHVIIEDSAKKCLDEIYYYNARYSIKNAITIDSEILQHIQRLDTIHYVGRIISEMSDNNFREIIYKKYRHSVYRIMYFISEKNKKIYVFSIISSKQEFIQVLKSNNYFNFYYNL